jgi:hypothetical protein
VTEKSVLKRRRESEKMKIKLSAMVRRYAFKFPESPMTCADSGDITVITAP